MSRTTSTSRALGLLAAGALLFAPAARAQQQGQGFKPSFITVSAGRFTPEGSDLTVNEAENGTVVMLNSGYMMDPYRGLQIDLGYFETSGANQLKVSAFPIALTFRLALPMSAVEPYLLGGAGVYFTSARLEAPGVSVDENATKFAPHAGGGINFTFGKLQVGAEARYVWLDASGLDVDGWMIMGKVGTRY